MKNLTWSERFGLDALTVLKNRDHRVVFIILVLFSIPLAAFYPYAPLHLARLGFERTSAWMALGQVSEIIAMFSLGLLLAKWRLKWIFCCGLGFGVARFAFSAMNTPGWLQLGVLLHGASYTLVLITAQIYLDQRVDPSWRARAQALMSLMSGGVGNLAGYLGTGWWFSFCLGKAGTNWPVFWSGLSAMVGCIAIYFLVAYRGQRTIRVAAIGTGEGIDTIKAYLETARQKITPGLNSKGNPFDPICFPDFPGANLGASFRVNFVTETAIQRVIPETYFAKAVESAKVSTKLKQVVDLIVAKLQTLADCEPEPDVVVIVLPPCVEKECATVGAAFRGQKVVLSPIQKMLRRFEKQRAITGQELLQLDFSDPAAQATGYWNLHHALKAHAMSTGLTTQIAWETTLRGEGLTQDPASAAWNFFTALYYKSNNIPWQLAAVPQNTCFVGVTFYKESPLEGADMQSSLAQVFSGHGEGLVLKGEKALVDKKRDRKPHLTETGAQQLLSKALALYQQMHGVKPARVVLHKTSRYWPEELQGFKKALGDIPNHDFLALDRLGVRFMRVGQKPPLRGTVKVIETRIR